MGRVLFEGGGQTGPGTSWTQGLVDEFHRFSSDTPAGGKPAHLDTSALPHTRAAAAFKGGRWEVLTRR